jgi:hypothetical protein
MGFSLCCGDKTNPNAQIWKIHNFLLSSLTCSQIWLNSLVVITSPLMSQNWGKKTLISV